jgi:hypothetical protein
MLCAFILFVFFYVQVAVLRRADPPSKESYRLCIDEETEKVAKIQQKDGRAIDRYVDNTVNIYRTFKRQQESNEYSHYSSYDIYEICKVGETKLLFRI